MNDKEKNSSLTKVLRILLLMLAVAVLFYLGIIIGKRAKDSQQLEPQSYFSPTTINLINA